MPEISIITEWLLHYGEFALFILLALGIIGLPIPDETLLALSGVLAAKQKFSLTLVLIVGFFGAATGITVSYFLGFSLGHFLLEKYGPKVGITENKIQRVQKWFDTIGKWTIVFGYFIPGVRHITGYLAGATRLNFFHFALYAYSGAILWSQGFILLGYFFGSKWAIIIDVVVDYVWYGIAVISGILLIYLSIKFYKKYKKG